VDVVSVVLVVVLLLLVFGGTAYPRPAEGMAGLNLVLYVLAAVVLVVIAVRVLGGA
jgi:uncharacterized membrane protein